MKTSLKISLVCLIILTTVISIASIDFGCTSSSLTNVWRDPEFKNPPMTKMFIIAAKKKPVVRRLWEDEIVASLSVQGVKSTPSYRLFADSIPDPSQVAAAVRENEFDGVLFIRRLPTKISTSYVEGYVKKVPVTRYNKRTQTYDTFYREVQEPGYTDTTKVARNEISVFTTQPEGGFLIWAGTGETIDPSSRQQVRHEISSLIAPELVRQGIIPEK
jgi:hypothetical protein